MTLTGQGHNTNIDNGCRDTDLVAIGNEYLGIKILTLLMTSPWLWQVNVLSMLGVLKGQVVTPTCLGPDNIISFTASAENRTWAIGLSNGLVPDYVRW